MTMYALVIFTDASIRIEGLFYNLGHCFDYSVVWGLGDACVSQEVLGMLL